MLVRYYNYALKPSESEMFDYKDCWYVSIDTYVLLCNAY